jgi:hypothetical protein
MIQRQLYIYLMLVMSIVLNLFQLPGSTPGTQTAALLGGKPLPVPAVQESTPAMQVPPAPILLTSIPSTPAAEKYEIDAVMDYERHFMTVEEIITYPNRTGVTLDSLTLAVAPNLSPNCFDLIRLSVDGLSATNYHLDQHRLNIKLPTALEPDSTVQLTLRYTLSLPYLDQFNSINARVFGHTDVQTNLINWYPFVVPFIDGEWVLHDPWFYGEYLVYPLADYSVNLLFIGAETDLVVASSGSAEKIEAFTRYTLEGGRAFVFSISPNFEVSSMKVGGTTIFSYYLPRHRKPAEAAMKTSAQALQLFSEQFGPYPRSTLSIVQADLSDSREFSGLSFISRNFYQLYDGTSKNYLTFASVHTTAHQWWFDQVGNDQALEPWLDESLAIYSEQLYFENVQPNVLAYWQANRVDFFRPRGRINASIYDFNYDAYKQAVYFNGVYFLHDLREQMGDYVFHDFLKDYYLRGQGKIMTGDDFFRILEQHTMADPADLVHQYFEDQ